MTLSKVNTRDLQIIRRLPTRDEVVPLPNEALKFDIINFKVYNTESGTFPSHDLFPSTAKLEFRFDGGVLVIPGKDGGLEMKVQGSFPLLTNPGNMAPHDMDAGSHAESQILVEGWLKNVGVAEESKLWGKAVTANIPFKCALFCPGMKLEDAHELLLLEIICIVLGDTMEQYPGSGITYDEFNEAITTISSICQGDKYDSDFGKGTKFPNFSILSALCVQFREMMKKLGMERSLEVIRDLVEYIEMQAWEMDKWWQDCASNEAQPKDFYYFRKELTHGLKMKIELLCVYRNIMVSDKARRDPLFALLKRQWVRMCVIAEAIFSVRKDLDEKNDDNCLLMRTRKKVSAMAVEKTVGDIKACIRDSTSFESQLNMKFEDTPVFLPVQEYYAAGKSLVDAHYQYLILSKEHAEFKVVVDVISDVDAAE